MEGREASNQLGMLMRSSKSELEIYTPREGMSGAQAQGRSVSDQAALWINTRKNGTDLSCMLTMPFGETDPEVESWCFEP